ncbi:MAG: AbrB/MazE/SpoVT family DNA-binding domain-containing protein [Lentisphaerae bacterium]|nr:AbrB/MazE/SpoVT family DNA-binding domain-containing protein [Lentisphaerota bacterium]
MITEISRVGKRGTFVIPADLRRRFNVTEGSFVSAEETAEGILLRPTAIMPMETYSVVRKAEFLLSNAVDAADYADAVKVVKAMGVSPSTIRHHKPVRRHVKQKA